MNRHNWLGQVKDPILREILQHIYDNAQSASDVQAIIGSQTVTVNEGGGSATITPPPVVGGGIDVHEVIPGIPD
jgi:hypothetical protein